MGLPNYSVTNLTVSRTINRNVDVFFGVQNLFDTIYYVGTNPTTIGTPRLVNGGIRLKCRPVVDAYRLTAGTLRRRTKSKDTTLRPRDSAVKRLERLF